MQQQKERKKSTDYAITKWRETHGKELTFALTVLLPIFLFCLPVFCVVFIESEEDITFQYCLTCVIIQCSSFCFGEDIMLALLCLLSVALICCLSLF